jgi:hypothetical protein
MSEKPILFSGAMVRALLRDEDPKTQTRRIMKPQPPATTTAVQVFHHPDPRAHFYANDGAQIIDWAKPCPHGEVGDRLYVRETWQHSNHPLGPYEPDCLVFYRADYFDDPHGPDGEKSPEGKYRDWRPSIHMPRTASRITLEITGVRAERLQSISAADAWAEGIPHSPDVDPAHEYRDLWDSLNAERGYGWDTNPWVWVVEFRKIS